MWISRFSCAIHPSILSLQLVFSKKNCFLSERKKKRVWVRNKHLQSTRLTHQSCHQQHTMCMAHSPQNVEHFIRGNVFLPTWLRYAHRLSLVFFCVSISNRQYKGPGHIYIVTVAFFSSSIMNVEHAQKTFIHLCKYVLILSIYLTCSNGAQDASNTFSLENRFQYRTSPKVGGSWCFLPKQKIGVRSQNKYYHYYYDLTLFWRKSTNKTCVSIDDVCTLSGWPKIFSQEKILAHNIVDF